MRVTIPAAQWRLQVHALKGKARCAQSPVLQEMVLHGLQKAAHTPTVPDQYRQTLPGCSWPSSLVFPAPLQSPFYWLSESSYPSFKAQLRHHPPFVVFFIVCALFPHCVSTDFFTSSSYRKGPLYTKTLWLWLLPLLLTRAGSQQAGTVSIKSRSLATQYPHTILFSE